MFTGIIEAQGTLVALRHEGTNVHLDVRAPFTSSLQIDQSVAHDGVCLTVVAIDGDVYTVTATKRPWPKPTSAPARSATCSTSSVAPWWETASMAMWCKAMDTTGTLASVETRDGSWIWTVEHPHTMEWMTVPKGASR